MRVLIADVECAGLDLAARMAADGHDVRLAQKTAHPIGRGFKGVKVVQDWRGSMTWAGKDGLIVMTGNAKWAAEMDRYRDLGYHVFGPTAASAKLEIDRKAGMEAMKAVGIELPPYECFKTLEEAESYAKKTDHALVFKPMGSEDNKALTYVGSDPADMVGWIQRQIKRGMVLKGDCMLQKRIDMVAELGASSWMGPDGFLPGKIQECWEFKKQLSDDLGQSTGEEGTVCQYVDKSKLFDDFLKPMEPVLRTMGHRGDFAIGCGITKDGKAIPFEFTSRLGYPAVYIQIASHKGDSAEWMMDLLRGEDSLKVDRRVAIGVVCSQPPYPQYNGDLACVDGVPITGLDDVWPDVHPVMLQIGNGPFMEDGKIKTGPQYQSAGELLFVMTGLGQTVSAARKSVYGSLEDVRWSDRQFRADIGCRLEKQLPLVHEHGFALETFFD